MIPSAIRTAQSRRGICGRRNGKSSHPASALSSSVPIALLRMNVTTEFRIDALSDPVAAPCGLIINETAQAITAPNSST